MIIPSTPEKQKLVLAAMRQIASAGGARELTAVDRATLVAFARFILGQAGDAAASLDTLPVVTPEQFAAAITDPAQRGQMVQFLIIMAVVDGQVDPDKIALVRQWSNLLGTDEDGVEQLARLAAGNLQWVAADAQRQNILSITGRDLDIPLDEWILPYRGAGRADPALAERFRALGKLPGDTLGRVFYEFYHDNGFAFPGEPDGLNVRFATAHDSTHVLSGYDRTPQGELLVSTFTAGMHKKEAMSGHILPVIMSWHMGIELVPFAGADTGQLAPEKFWVAWERGSRTTADIFDDAWDFWAAAARPIEELRREYGIPPLPKARGG
ncbi:hypothetical protein QQ054_15850 [Oscillatoria amoena NRMC-F 0135]|nr:hypothetical protein [Oscillatoria laete-virens]MDL5047489.1 hypothetical protein [Oscillatoria amoena NRMC-F 0135]MDL5054686.1 hypothetical protein [Oscillatoria laete-virens NRMC-F 0139]